MIAYRNLLLTLADEYEIDQYSWKLPSDLLKNSFWFTVKSRVLTRVTIQKIRFFTVSNSNTPIFF